MNFNVEAFIRPQNLQVLKQSGLHKTAAALNGIDELTIKHAVAILATKVRQKRAEARRIADGLAALAALRGDKIAGAPSLGGWGPHLTSAVPAGLLGAGIGYALSPDDPDAQKKMMLQAGLMGLLGGGLHSIHNTGFNTGVKRV